LLACWFAFFFFCWLTSLLTVWLFWIPMSLEAGRQGRQGGRPGRSSAWDRLHNLLDLSHPTCTYLPTSTPLPPPLPPTSQQNAMYNTAQVQMGCAAKKGAHARLWMNPPGPTLAHSQRDYFTGMSKGGARSVPVVCVQMVTT
jgi:hypothetical protein